MRTLPIRLWLTLALLALVAIPILTVAGLGVGLAQSDSASMPVAKIVQQDGALWHDDAWQRMVSDLAVDNGIDLVLVDDTGTEILRTAENPTVDPTGSDRATGKDGLMTSRAEAVYPVKLPSGGTGLAYIYGDTGNVKNERSDVIGIPFVAFVILLAGILAFIGTLGGVIWFVGPAVLRPLAAMGQAAQAIAAGNLDVTIPASRVREVAAVSAAFAAMGSALRASIEREAELEQERRLFVGAIAHDLRTPLFSLRGFLQGLEQGLAATPERAARYIAVCQDKAAVLDRLIADLFAYARAEYLQQVPRPESFDLAALLAKTVDGLRPMADAKAITLVLSGPTPCPATGDTHLLARAIDNLLDNAIRHTPAGGRIEIDCRRDGQRVLFTVTDTGPGIAQHDLPHLFTPLYRAETSRNRQTGGAGLGLDDRPPHPPGPRRRSHRRQQRRHRRGLHGRAADPIRRIGTHRRRPPSHACCRRHLTPAPVRPVAVVSGAPLDRIGPGADSPDLRTVRTKGA